jgi:hypothetical protein
LELNWSATSQQIVFRGPGLFGALAIQLLLEVTATTGYVKCHHCSTLYEPKHALRPDRRNFCGPCAKQKVAVLYAKRDSSLRRAESRQLHSRGVDIKTISKITGSAEEVVGKWVLGKPKGRSTKSSKTRQVGRRRSFP